MKNKKFKLLELGYEDDKTKPYIMENAKYCNARGYPVDNVIEEFGSGINDKRPKLQKLLNENVQKWRSLSL